MLRDRNTKGFNLLPYLPKLLKSLLRYPIYSVAVMCSQQQHWKDGQGAGEQQSSGAAEQWSSRVVVSVVWAIPPQKSCVKVIFVLVPTRMLIQCW